MRDISIEQIMTPDPATISPQSSAAEARRLLNSNFINHLPVVEGDRLVGMVSSSDLLKLHLLDDSLTMFARATVDQIMETHLVVLSDSATLRKAAEKLVGELSAKSKKRASKRRKRAREPSKQDRERLRALGYAD